MRSPSSWLPSDTLLEEGRVNRPPLRAWAKALIEKLAAADRGPASWRRIEACMNNASLIEILRGDEPAAQASCELQLGWAVHLLQSHGALAAGELMIQPWINLGRLRRIRGEHALALRHFTLLVDTAAGRGPRVGPVTFGAAAWQELVRSKGLLPTLQAVYVIESEKVYLAAGDHAGALELIRRARALIGEDTSSLMDEGELIALAGLSRHGEARGVLERAGWQKGPYRKLLWATYGAALLAAAGDLEDARRLVGKIGPRVAESHYDEARDQRVLRYLAYLGGLSLRLGLRPLAARVWRAGLRGARRLADVPLELRFLDALLEFNGEEDQEALSAQRDALLRDSLYAIPRDPRGPVAAPAADPLFDELRAAARGATAIGAGASLVSGGAAASCGSSIPYAPRRR
jgi:tetratricopeptide (TPR) repeat protein